MYGLAAIPALALGIGMVQPQLSLIHRFQLHVIVSMRLAERNIIMCHAMRLCSVLHPACTLMTTAA